MMASSSSNVSGDEPAAHAKPSKPPFKFKYRIARTTTLLPSNPKIHFRKNQNPDLIYIDPAQRHPVTMNIMEPILDPAAYQTSDDQAANNTISHEKNEEHHLQNGSHAPRETDGAQSRSMQRLFRRLRIDTNYYNQQAANHLRKHPSGEKNVEAKFPIKKGFARKTIPGAMNLTQLALTKPRKEDAINAQPQTARKSIRCSARKSIQCFKKRVAADNENVKEFCNAPPITKKRKTCSRQDSGDRIMSMPLEQKQLFYRTHVSRFILNKSKVDKNKHTEQSNIQITKCNGASDSLELANYNNDNEKMRNGLDREGNALKVAVTLGKTHLDINGGETPATNSIEMIQRRPTDIYSGSKNGTPSVKNSITTDTSSGDGNQIEEGNAKKAVSVSSAESHNGEKNKISDEDRQYRSRFLHYRRKLKSLHHCPYCPVVVNNFLIFERHKKNHRIEEDANIHRCALCGYGSDQMSAMRKHIRVHTDVHTFYRRQRIEISYGDAGVDVETEDVEKIPLERVLAVSKKAGMQLEEVSLLMEGGGSAASCKINNAKGTAANGSSVKVEGCTLEVEAAKTSKMAAENQSSATTSNQIPEADHVATNLLFNCRTCFDTNIVKVWASSEVTTQQKVEEIVRKFQCKYCGQKFCNEIDMENHRAQHLLGFRPPLPTRHFLDTSK